MRSFIGRILCWFGHHAYGPINTYQLDPGSAKSVLGWLDSPTYWVQCGRCGAKHAISDW